MKNKLLFLCFAAMIASETVKSQNNEPLLQTEAPVQMLKKLNIEDIYLHNPYLLRVTMKFTSVEDNTEYMFYGDADFPVTQYTYVGSIPAGYYNVEIGDFGSRPVLMIGRTNCDVGYTKQGEPLYWYNHAIGDGCGEYFEVAKMYLDL